jgi:hypothetical protein
MHQFVPLNSTFVHLGHRIFIIYTKISFIKLRVVESNGFWWNELLLFHHILTIVKPIGLVELLA